MFLHTHLHRLLCNAMVQPFFITMHVMPAWYPNLNKNLKNIDLAARAAQNKCIFLKLV